MKRDILSLRRADDKSVIVPSGQYSMPDRHAVLDYATEFLASLKTPKKKSEGVLVLLLVMEIDDYNKLLEDMEIPYEKPIVSQWGSQQLSSH